VKLHALKVGLPGKVVSVYNVAIVLTRVGAVATFRPIKSAIFLLAGSAVCYYNKRRDS
jgi:hypothetical protein